MRVRLSNSRWSTTEEKLPPRISKSVDSARGLGVPALFKEEWLFANIRRLAVGSRGHAWPNTSRGEAFPDNGPRYRLTSGHGHHRRHTHGRAQPAERERRTE